MNRILCIAFITFSLGTPIANAVPTAPSLKPNNQFQSNVIENNAYKNLNDALDAADRGNWSKIRNELKRNNSEAVNSLLLWKLTTNSSANPTFKELKTALNLLPDWPKQHEIQKQAESLLSSSGMKDHELKNWFETFPPITGTGKLVHARLLKRSGQKEQSKALIKDIWWNHSLAYSNEKELIREFSSFISQSDNSKRADMLLWANQRSAAKRLIKKLPSSERKLIEARLALMEKRRGVDKLIKAVPKSRQKDPGLLYERAVWRRKRAKNYDGAIEAILDIDPALTSVSGNTKIWRERRLLLRTLIKENRWAEAYKISAQHGMTRGVGFAEAEFYSGWTALRYLDQPKQALEHFTTLSEGVGSPISLARGLYWKGESLIALNEVEKAQEAYVAAAQHNHVFYGQMAAQRLKSLGVDEVQLEFIIPELATEEDKQAFEAKPIIQAAKLLAESGRKKSFERFSFHIDDSLESPQDHQLLSDLAIHYLEPRAGVRNGKAGLAKGNLAPDAAFPVVELPQSTGSGIAEPALVMALSRQESELMPTAVSHANAHGMMQLLPATGRQKARSSGLPYRTSWLTDDPTYNFRLGRGYLDDLIDDFNGSYILALAAYNAGPSRPKRWIQEYGDPRKGEIDPIDFIESIPFSETRNYVQRILENTQVYRHRLSGSPTDIRLMNDLSRGNIKN